MSLRCGSPSPLLFCRRATVECSSGGFPALVGDGRWSYYPGDSDVAAASASPWNKVRALPCFDGVLRRRRRACALSFACERVDVVILVGMWLFRSPVFRSAAADFFFLSLSVKVTADVLSSKSIRLVVFWAMVVAACPMLGVPRRAGRWIRTDAAGTTTNWKSEMRKTTLGPEDSFVIFLFFRDQFVIGRMYCSCV